MKRQEFIKSCGLICAGSLLLPMGISSCAGSRIVQGELRENELVLPLSTFERKKKDQIEHREFVIAQHPELKYPVCIYRNTEDKYQAFLLRCTHQGAELQVFGDKMVCPAHGSEFNRQGEVENGPAFNDLKSFETRKQNEELWIKLV
ncbi:MAG: Rieske (2Fe-2S) protein [Bacteroidetes bacterium]|nr:MAG: Rieske (2Fe-2S) protein [Bacteroidota bacterium]